MTFCFGQAVCVSGVGCSQGGEGLQRVEGSRSDAGQLVVVQRQQADVVQPCETVVVDAADLVVSQHPEGKGRHTHTTTAEAQPRVGDDRWLQGHSQHPQPLQPTEHPTSDRVDLIGREVKLVDGRRAFERPVFDLCDLVVAEVAARGEWLCQEGKPDANWGNGGGSLTFSSAGKGS